MKSLRKPNAFGPRLWKWDTVVVWKPGYSRSAVELLVDYQVTRWESNPRLALVQEITDFPSSRIVVLSSEYHCW